jgi:hypothetical protein
METVQRQEGTEWVHIDLLFELVCAIQTFQGTVCPGLPCFAFLSPYDCARQYQCKCDAKKFPHNVPPAGKLREKKGIFLIRRMPLPVQHKYNVRDWKVLHFV